MNDDKPTFWFYAKTYGWGWGLPSCWQGWAVLLGYVLLVQAGIWYFRTHHEPTALTIYVFTLTAAFVTVVALKGEKAGWRWGKK